MSTPTDPLPPVQDPGPADEPDKVTRHIMESMRANENPPPLVNTDGVPPPLSLEQIKAQVRFRHQNAVEMLDSLRKQRKTLDAQIRDAVIEETEARRMARALEPRSKAAKK